MRLGPFVSSALVGLLLVAAPLWADPSFFKMALVNSKSLYTNTTNTATNTANLQTNLNNILNWIDVATAQGAEFVGFPEVSLNGYSFSSNMTWLSLAGPQVAAIKDKAVQKGVYISVGLAEQDANNQRWNTQIVVDPTGQIVGWHHKTWLTNEAGYVTVGTDHNVFPVKDGLKMGIITCADGTDYYNLKALADNGAQIIYGPHANTTGGTIQGWYNFRAKWGGSYTGTWSDQTTSNNGPAASMPTGGWIDNLNVYAALHNHAAWYNPPRSGEPSMSWASGAWFIGPDGLTLAQEPTTGANGPDVNGRTTYESMLIYNVPLPADIPEPVSLSLLLVGASTLLLRRQR